MGLPIGQEIIVNTSFEGGQFGLPVLGTAPTTVNAGMLGQRYPTKTFLMATGPLPGSNRATLTIAPLVGNAIAEAGTSFPAIAAHATLGRITVADGAAPVDWPA